MKGNEDKGDEAVELLQELFRVHDGRSEIPLISYLGNGGWQIWTRSQTIHWLRRRPSVVTEEREKNGRSGDHDWGQRNLRYHRE